MNLCKNTKAFTIVELLVVIVVIGILAAISLVSYSGINLKAITVALQSDLSSNAKLLKLYNVDHGYYPDSIDANYCPSAPDTDARYCLKTSNGNSLSYAGGGQSFTLTATNSNGLSYSINENSQITENASSNSSFANVWDASDYDYGSAIAKTSDGGYVTVGGTYSYSDANSYSDAFISKYSSDGVLSWMKTWGGSSDDDAQDIIQSSDGGFVMVGYTRSYGLGDGAGGDDAFIAKFNSSGDLIWNRVWGGDSSDYGNGVIQLSDGNYMMIGYNGSFGSDADSAFLAKYSESGDLIWSKSWNGSSYDQAFDIINTSDNGFAITGTTRSFGAGNEDVFIAKYTSDGTLSWSRTWGKDGTEEGNSIIQTSDGDYVISGTTRILGAGSTGVNAFIAKFKSDGMLLWSKDWGGASQSDTSTNVSLAADGGYVIVGETRSYGAGGLDAFVAKFLSNGALLWSEVIGGSGSDFGRGRAVQTADGGFVLTGGLGSYGYSGYGDSLLLKIKSDGKISCSLITCQNVSAASADLTVSMNSAAATEESITVVLNNPSVTIVNRNPTKVKIAP